MRHILSTVTAAVVYSFIGVAPVGAAPCIGDCSSDGSVTVDELVRGVNIALGNLPLPQCVVLDKNGDGEVTVDELIAAVNNALVGCLDVDPTPTPSPAATATPTGLLFGGNISEMVPHAVNDRLVYRVTEGTKVTTESNTVIAVADGGVFTVDVVEAARHERQTFVDIGTLLFLREVADLDDHVSTKCVPAIVQLGAPLRAGEPISSLSGCDVRTLEGDRLLGIYRQETVITPVEVVDSFTVPAGTYTNVVHLTSLAQFSAGSTGTETHDVHVAPGIGVLRDVMTSGDEIRVRELVDGSVGGQSVRR